MATRLEQRIEKIEASAHGAVKHPITRIVLVPFRREGEPKQADEREVVIWERKENAG